MKTIFYLIIGFLLLLLTQLISHQKQANPHGNIKTDCAECHTSKGWQIKGARSFFDHNRTGFLLLGAHRIADCRSCHANLTFSHTGTACADCHTDIHKGELGINCENCHTPQNWENRQLILENHNLTQFPLIAIHAVVDCEACHINQQRNEYANTPIECKYCHYQNFIEATNPDHQTAGFSLACLSCHKFTAVSWKQTEYQHSLSFPLTGAHQILPCESCHINGQYSVLPTDCWSCHETDFNSVSDPDHIQNNFNHDCTICHSTQAWTPTTFDHISTAFPLTGAHQSLNCIDCHSQGYAGTPTDCWSCHETDFIGVSDPDHIQNNFNHDCTVCHSTQTWTPAIVDHSTTNFPLTGAHISLNCIDCHSQGYAGTPTDCWSCHESNFNGVSDPDHIQNNFNQDCTVCHSTQAWTPATFDHGATNFPLTGAHQSLNCVDCHSQGYAGTPTDCFSCHDSDYNDTTNPNHLGAGFPTSCEDCHNTTNWNQTTWDHDSQYFPIYSRKHNNKWNTCDECHVDPNNYSVFECIFCHKHSDQAKVDNDHNEVSGYVYASWACYDCHPDGDKKFKLRIKMKKAH